MRQRQRTQLRCTLIYDAGCHFCTGIAKWLVRFIGKDRLDIVSNRSRNLNKWYSREQRERFKKDVHFVNKCSIVYSAGNAVANVIALKKGLGFIGWLNNNVAPIRFLFQVVYYITKKTKKYYNIYLG